MGIKHLYIDTSVTDFPASRDFAARLGLEPQYLDDPQPIFSRIKASSDPWQTGKEVLWLTRNRGEFIKKCPGTRDYTCCGYQILHIGTYCTMDCSYCILQGYFHPPFLQYFINFDDLTTELDKRLADKETLRIGTGEFTDSLIWEPWSGLTSQLVARFARQNVSVLELKTKTVAVNQLEGLHHNRKTILAWSVNTPRIIQSQERGTASLASRLKTAARCCDWGYPVAFHFDPMIIYPGCAQEYIDVLDLILEHVAAENIVWISMGTFRSMPALHPIIRRRFPDSKITYGEFIPGLDGKMRYFKTLRIDLYRRMVDRLNAMAPDVLMYLCMESDQVWRQSFGFAPQEKGGLAAMLDAAATSHCNLRK